MKKEISKILIVIGLIVVLLGFLLDGLVNKIDADELSKYDYGYAYRADSMRNGSGALISGTALGDCLFVAIACAFALSKNQSFVNMGYLLGAIAGIFCIVMFPSGKYMLIISSLGMILMLIAAVIYLVSKMLNFFGFVKAGATSVSDTSTLLKQYKQMEENAIITADEFVALKSKLFHDFKPRANSLEELKNWKALCDQGIITEEEFSNVKSKLF
ncbi:MAG: SHOCT domain-containing protein [Clostridia bacterium]|nr:SHOCT domain-containing protein [Clostridia bacterium]